MMVYGMIPVKRCAYIKTKCRANKNKYFNKFLATHITLFSRHCCWKNSLSSYIHVLQLLLLLVSCSYISVCWCEFERLLQLLSNPIKHTSLRVQSTIRSQ